MNSTDIFKRHVESINKLLEIYSENGVVRNHEFFTLIANITYDGILLLQNGIIVYANNAALNLLGYDSIKKIEKLPYQKVIHADYINIFSQITNSIISSTKNVKYIANNGDYNFCAETASIKIEYNSTPTEVIIFRDITQECNSDNIVLESREFLNQTESITKSGSYKINLNTGKAYWTKGVYKIFNYPEENDLPGVDEYYKMVHEDDVSGLKEELGNTIETLGIFDLKYRIITCDNEVKYVHSKGEIEVVGDVKFLVGNFRDITKEVHDEEKIKQVNEYYDTLVNTIQEGVSLNEAIYDKNGEVTDHRILYVNKAFNKQSYYNDTDIVGKLASEAYNLPENYMKDWWQKNKDSEFPVRSELYQEHTDRWSYISTSEINARGQFVTAFFDKTDEKKNQLLLRESESKYRNLIENMPIGIVKFNSERVIFANKASRNILGNYTSDEIEKLNFLDLVAEVEKSRFITILKNAKETDTVLNSKYILSLKTKSGDKVYVELMIYEVTSDEEPVYKCSFENITDRIENYSNAKKLATDSVYLSRKIEAYDNIRVTIDNIIEKNGLDKKLFLELYKILNAEWNLEQLWAIFQSNFEIIEKDFFRKLLKIAPNLSQQELRHCAFIRMNFETKEIAVMFHVKPSSIQIARVRLKKKLKLGKDDDLISYIMLI